MKKTIYIVVLTFLVASCGKKKDHVGDMKINFTHFVGDKVLELNETKYLINNKDTVSFLGLKYMISNVELYKAGELVYSEPDSYHLLDEEGIKNFTLDSVPVGEYDELRLSIGVDEANDNDKNNIRDLSTNNGLFWSGWGSYIYMQLDGLFYKNDTLSIAHHIGGAPNYKIISFDLSSNVLKVADGAETVVEIKFDLEELYKTPVVVDFNIADNRIISADSRIMNTIGGNYGEGGLSITNITNP